MRGYSVRIAVLALLALPGAALAQPNLALTKSGPTSAVAGTSITYTFTIENNGAGVATDVELDDVLPAGLTLLGDSLNACGVTATAANHQQTVNCALPNIPAGGELVVRMSVLVEHDFLPDRGAFATNTATVTTTGETNAADNTDAAPSLAVSGAADLAVYTFAPANPVPAGEVFTYTIYVDNLGPSTAEWVIIGDALAASSNVSIQSCALSVSQSGGAITQFTCTTGTVVGSQFLINIGQMATNFVDPRGAPCDWNPAADPGAEEDCSQSFGTVSAGRVRISFRLLALQDLTIEAFTTVAAETPDPDTSNNVATDTVDFFALADLEVQKVAGPAVDAGEIASWDVTVINHGPSAAANVELLDTLPGGLVDGTVTITGDVVSDVLGTPVVEAPVSCSLGTPGSPEDPARCDLGGLPAGWGAILTVSGRVHPNFIAAHGGVSPPIGLTNDVAVTSDTLDAVFEENEPGDCTIGIGPCPPAPDEPNFASATVMVADSADLGLQAFAVGSFEAGEPFHYELQIDNVGPSVSRDLTLRAFLPSQVTFLSAAVDLEGGSGFDPLPCYLAAGSNALFCPLGDLPITGPVPIIAFVDVVLDPNVPDGTILSLNADVFLSDTPDPVAADNSVNVMVAASNSAPDTLTEVFGSGEIDLAGWQIEITPAASPGAGYEACVTGVTAPIDPNGAPSSVLSLGDDDFQEVVLSYDKKIKLFGIKYDRVYVGSNGYVTLLTGDLASLADPAIHFDLKRVSAFFADLDPSDGGMIYTHQFDDMLQIAWADVPGYSDADTSTFYLEMYFDGRIHWKLVELDGLPSVVGISNGAGLPEPFFETNFAPPGATYPLCPGIFSDGFESGNTLRWQ